jgi:hypothetical protein
MGRENQKSAMQAEHAAAKRLVQLHAEEYDRLRNEERATRGLEPFVSRASRRKPCARCGCSREKSPGKGTIYCEPCKPLALAEKQERYAEKARQRRRAAGALPRAERTAIVKAEAETRRKAREIEKVERKRDRKLELERRRQERRAPRPIPSHIRAAWRRSSPGSILQRKYPTYDALQKAAQEGAFS